MKYILATLLALSSLSSFANNEGEKNHKECECLTCLIQNGVCVAYDGDTKIKDVKTTGTQRPTKAPTGVEN
jgi:hypothetical protein